jgi:hypothetical protein
MAEFPKLKTGAVAQYPAGRAVQIPCQVMRFVDGSEQRFPLAGGVRRAWEIRLDRLDEAELFELEQFFLAQQGELDDFEFADPWDGIVYPSCRLSEPEFAAGFAAAGRSRTVLSIQENRS